MLDANQIALYLAITLAGIATVLVPAYLVGHAVMRKRNRAILQARLDAEEREKAAQALIRAFNLKRPTPGIRPPRPHSTAIRQDAHEGQRSRRHADSDTGMPWIIPPASVYHHPDDAAIGDVAGRSDDAIASMTIGAGEFSGAGASGSWSSDTSSSPATSTSD